MAIRLDKLELIRKRYPWSGPPLAKDPFFGLIGIVLSQHTNDRNAWRAEKELEQTYASASILAKASTSQIAKVIKVAGMQNEKAITVHELAVRETKEGFIESILEMPWEKAREKLMELNGIGAKTADVFCMIYLGAPVLPIDVHIKRVSQRLGLTKSNDYFKIQRDLHKLVSPDQRKTTHLSMIRFGREVCRAKRPRCSQCPLRLDCPWYLSSAKLQAGPA